MSDPLEGFPVTVEIPVAWGDMDAFGHVNNTVYSRFFETARIAYFEAIGFLGGQGGSSVGPILASADCRFRLPLEYPDRVIVGARADNVTGTGLMTHYRVLSTRHGKLAAEGGGRIVSFDYERGAKAPLPSAIVRAIAQLEADLAEAS